MKDIELEYYINRSRPGSKIPKPVAGDEVSYKKSIELYKEFHRHWEPVKTSAVEMCRNVYRGFSFAPMHSGRKIKANFSAAWHIGLDYDHSSLAELQKDSMCAMYASFGYATPSSTKENPKSRIVIILDKPITDFEIYEDVLEAFVWYSNWLADPQCIDAARFFYGSLKCEYWHNWSILPLDVAMDLRQQWLDANPKIAPSENYTANFAAGQYSRYAEKAIEKMGEDLRLAGAGAHHAAMMRVGTSAGTLVAAPWANVRGEDLLRYLVSCAIWATSTAERKEVERCLKDAMGFGKQNPRPLPEQKPLAIGAKKTDDHKAKLATIYKL